MVFSCHHLHLPFTTYSNIGWSLVVQKPVSVVVTRQHPRAVLGWCEAPGAQSVAGAGQLR